MNATIHEAPASQLTQWLDCLARNADVLVAVGGDGTVSAVADAVVRSRKVLAIIPTGTLNHFARDAGIPTEIDEALAVLRSGRVRAVDVGTVNDRLFINNISLGNYPRMVHERDALEGNGRSRPVAETIAIARTWWNLRELTVTLKVDDLDLVRRSPFIVVGNGSYSLSGFSLGQRDEISDGRLSLYVAPAAGRMSTLLLPLRALSGTLERHEQFETMQADRITMSFERPTVGAGIDGEVVDLQSPLEFKIHRRALRDPGAGRMRTVVHLSDLHFGRIDRALVEPLRQAVVDAKPDLVAISGDFTQRARRAQFADARAFIDSLNTRTLVVPGNHDIPLYDFAERLTAPLRRYRDYISADLEPEYIDEEMIVIGVNTARAIVFPVG